MSDLNQTFDNIIDEFKKFAEAAGVDLGGEKGFLHNKKQPVWLTFGDSHDSLSDIVDPFDREDINNDWLEIYGESEEKEGKKAEAYERVALKLQNDWLGAVARDVLEMRKPRLYRIYSRARALSGLKSIVREVVRKRVSNILKTKSTMLVDESGE